MTSGSAWSRERHQTKKTKMATRRSKRGKRGNVVKEKQDIHPEEHEEDSNVVGPSQMVKTARKTPSRQGTTVSTDDVCPPPEPSTSVAPGRTLDGTFDVTKLSVKKKAFLARKLAEWAEVEDSDKSEKSIEDDTDEDKTFVPKDEELAQASMTESEVEEESEVIPFPTQTPTPPRRKPEVEPASETPTATGVWGGGKEAEMCQLWEQEPSLYDFTAPGHRDPHVRERILQRFSIRLDIPRESSP